MIPWHETTPGKAAAQFAEWASCFSEELFVMLLAYFDESITSNKGESFIVVGGYIALREHWLSFSDKWRAILDNYGLKNFHFREFNAKANYSNPNSQFYKWDDAKRDDCFYDLAMLMSETIVPVGGDYSIALHQKLHIGDDLFENVFADFYRDVRVGVTDHWPAFGKESSERILFVYDIGAWHRLNAAALKMLWLFKAEDARFGGLA